MFLFVYVFIFICKQKNDHFFFFSSRRRHTRWNCDWSSDVCSSDLGHCSGFHRPYREGRVERPSLPKDARLLAADTVRVSPGPFEGEPPSVGGNELMDGIRSPRTRGVEANRRRCLEQCARRGPQPFDAVGRREQRPIAAHRIENQALIGLEDVADKASVPHRELQTQFVQSHSRTGSLAVKRKRHLRRVRQVERQLSMEHFKAMKVSVSDSGLTPSSPRYPLYWPRTTSCGSMGRMLRKTLFFSSLMDDGSSAGGGSIATNARIWKRWVTTMSRKAPVAS